MATFAFFHSTSVSAATIPLPSFTSPVITTAFQPEHPSHAAMTTAIKQSAVLFFVWSSTLHLKRKGL